MKRLALRLVFLLVVALPLFAQGRPRPSAPPPPPPAAAAGEPLAGLTAAQLTAFKDGRGDFSQVETGAHRPGPGFNERPGAACPPPPPPAPPAPPPLSPLPKST